MVLLQRLRSKTPVLTTTAALSKDKEIRYGTSIDGLDRLVDQLLENASEVRYKERSDHRETSGVLRHYISRYDDLERLTYLRILKDMDDHIVEGRADSLKVRSLDGTYNLEIRVTKREMLKTIPQSNPEIVSAIEKISAE